MASIILLMCCCSCLSSSAAGGFVAGLIPGTSPHFEKVIRAKKMRRFIDLANELRLMSAELPMAEELPGDLTVKNAMLDAFQNLGAKSQELCNLYNELTNEEVRAEIKTGMKHYEKSGNESILTFSGFQKWKSYLDDLMKPSEETKSNYKKLTPDNVQRLCTWQSQDEERKNCLPFTSVDIALMEMKESCENLRDMMEQDPEVLVNDIIGGKQ